MGKESRHYPYPLWPGIEWEKVCPPMVLLGIEGTQQLAAGLSGKPAKVQHEGFYRPLILLLLLEPWFSSL